MTGTIAHFASGHEVVRPDEVRPPPSKHKPDRGERPRRSIARSMHARDEGDADSGTAASSSNASTPAHGLRPRRKSRGRESSRNIIYGSAEAAGKKGSHRRSHERPQRASPALREAPRSQDR